jgi:hypothetical protein
MEMVFPQRKLIFHGKNENSTTERIFPQQKGLFSDGNHFSTAEMIFPRKYVKTSVIHKKVSAITGTPYY